ncbi:TPA: hypothetical protein ACU3D6_002360 [Salmonella enterica]
MAESLANFMDNSLLKDIKEKDHAPEKEHGLSVIGVGVKLGVELDK